jgi:hypothetical protein
MTMLTRQHTVIAGLGIGVLALPRPRRFVHAAPAGHFGW